MNTRINMNKGKKNTSLPRGHWLGVSIINKFIIPQGDKVEMMVMILIINNPYHPPIKKKRMKSK